MSLGTGVFNSYEWHYLASMKMAFMRKRAALVLLLVFGLTLVSCGSAKRCDCPSFSQTPQLIHPDA